MSNITIMELMSKPIEDHDLKLQEAIRDNPEYIKTEKTVEELMEKVKGFDKKIWSDLDTEVNYREALAKDIAFNEGFKLAVRLILSSAMS